MSEQNKNRRPAGGRSDNHGGPFSRPVEKAKNFKGTLRRLIKYLKPHRINLIIVLIFAIASTTFTIAAPKVTSKAMNKLQDGYMAKMMLTQMSEAQIKAVEQINLQMQQASKGSGTLTADPETIKTIREFMSLPMLNTVTDADQKADICREIIELSKRMPGSEQYGQQNVKLTQEQIDGAIRAIRETNGEYDFHYIGVIALILLGMYLISASFSLIMGLVMSGVAQKTVRDLRREIDDKLSRLPLKYFAEAPAE
jgi:ATP-binding cassette subfamily B protein